MAAMATPKDVAVWMMQQVRPGGARLFQPDAIEHILQMFGPNFLSKKPAEILEFPAPFFRSSRSCTTARSDITVFIGFGKNSTETTAQQTA